MYLLGGSLVNADPVESVPSTRNLTSFVAVMVLVDSVTAAPIRGVAVTDTTPVADEPDGSSDMISSM
jgi:hypothetical protein